MNATMTPLSSVICTARVRKGCHAAEDGLMGQSKDAADSIGEGGEHGEEENKRGEMNQNF